jgi:hypothetical protein
MRSWSRHDRDEALNQFSRLKTDAVVPSRHGRVSCSSSPPSSSSDTGDHGSVNHALVARALEGIADTLFAVKQFTDASNAFVRAVDEAELAKDASTSLISGQSVREQPPPFTPQVTRTGRTRLLKRAAAANGSSRT